MSDSQFMVVRPLTDDETRLDEWARERAGAKSTRTERRVVDLDASADDGLRQCIQSACERAKATLMQAERRVIDLEASADDGLRQNLHFQPGCLFRGDTLLVDTPDDSAVRILSCFVGCKPQPLSVPVRVSSFSESELQHGNLPMDTCQPVQFISFGVEFLKPDAEFRARLFGSAIERKAP